MSPMSVTVTEGDSGYASPFVGAIGPTVQLNVDIENLSDDEIDAKGYIKPGVPLTKSGALIGADAKSTVAAAVAGEDNVGNGTVGSVSGGFDAPTETITLTCITEAANAGTFRVEGSVSGVLGVATVAVPFVSPIISFTIADGAEDFDIGDTFTLAATAGASDVLYGVVVEATKLVASNSDDDRVGEFSVVVTVHALVNRDILEDVLGRVLTAGEVDAFSDHGALQLTNTQ
jgi:hypothetical protein